MRGIVVFRTKIELDFLVEEDHFTIIFVEQGQLILQLGAQEKIVTAGHVLYHTPSYPMKIKEISDDLHFFGIKYTVAYLQRIKVLDDFHQSIAHFKHQFIPICSLVPEDQHKILELLVRLKEKEKLFGHHFFAEQLFNLSFTELVLELIEVGSKQDNAVFQYYNRAEYLALQFMILARKAYKEEVQLDFYANELNVSIKYLSETLKNIMGKTAKEILSDLRISKARFLLQGSSLSITEIAYELSYDSLASFSKYFKQIEGISPKDYRETYL